MISPLNYCDIAVCKSYHVTSFLLSSISETFYDFVCNKRSLRYPVRRALFSSSAVIERKIRLCSQSNLNDIDTKCIRMMNDIIMYWNYGHCNTDKLTHHNNVTMRLIYHIYLTISIKNYTLYHKITHKHIPTFISH